MIYSVSTKALVRMVSGLFLCLALASPAAPDDDPEKSALPMALEFAEGVQWLNVPRPLSMKELRGKVVVLDFWTYGCINCIHVLEDLHRLQEKYADKVAIIGVHTPKFDNEKNLETLRRIVVRYGIEHPVINDSESIMARRYGMRAWPTQFVITPEGRVLGKAVGEGNYQVFEEVIDTLLEEQAELIDEDPIPIALETERLKASFLAYPGKLAVSDKHVAISDTLHHRIVITDHSGRLQKIIGEGEPGLLDGPAERARFLRPQGLAFMGDLLYVADTGNHSIRQVDLNRAAVTTVAGTGKLETRVSEEGPASKASLRSPWDLVTHDGRLIIAMAGDHQLWELDVKNDQLKLFSGNGREALKDGSLEEASYSQPSGLSLINGNMYIADSESSAVREVDLQSGLVSTLVGTGLFDFGDADGQFSEVLLQHPLGVAAVNDTQLYIADTYNHKLKLLDLEKRTVQTVVGTGGPGSTTGSGQQSELNEPGGLAVLNGMILIADSNNHRILSFNPRSGQLSEWPVVK